MAIGLVFFQICRVSLLYKANDGWRLLAVWSWQLLRLLLAASVITSSSATIRLGGTEEADPESRRPKQSTRSKEKKWKEEKEEEEKQQEGRGD